MVLGEMNIHMQKKKNEIGLLPYTNDKNYVKMN